MAASNRGVTLLELMVSMTMLTTVSGVLFMLTASLGEAASVQEARIETVDQSRLGMQQVVRELRQSSTATVSWGVLPGAVIAYRVATDMDGNGYAVDAGGNLELSPLRRIQRDVRDLNNDGLLGSQLVLVEGDVVTVLANNLVPNEDVNGNGVLDAGEDQNANNQLDRGLLFELDNGGIRATLETEQAPGPDAVPLVSRLSEIVRPRN